MQRRTMITLVTGTAFASALAPTAMAATPATNGLNSPTPIEPELTPLPAFAGGTLTWHVARHRLS